MIAVETVDYGEAMGKDFIRKRPTSRDWKGRFASLPRARASVRKPTGRVDTGQMLNAFTGRIQVGNDTWKLDIGWVDGDPDDYYEYQDQLHDEPMFALADSQMETEQFIQNALKGWAGSYGS